MVSISKHIADIIFSHAKEDAPIEACGYLAGKNNVLSHCYRMTNMDQSSSHFTFSPKEQFKIAKEVRNQNLEILGVYHSHPNTKAEPSPEDIRLATDPKLIYLICSLPKLTLKAFRINKKTFIPEKLIFS